VLNVGIGVGRGHGGPGDVSYISGKQRESGMPVRLILLTTQFQRKTILNTQGVTHSKML